MDAQLKRGIVEVCVLRALKAEDSYGYKIIKDVSPHIEISESTLYPILKRLESSGYVGTYKVEHNGRLRKYYSISDKGKMKIEEFLNEWDEVVKAYNYIKKARVDE